MGLVRPHLSHISLSLSHLSSGPTAFHSAFNSAFSLPLSLRREHDPPGTHIVNENRCSSPSSFLHLPPPSLISVSGATSICLASCGEGRLLIFLSLLIMGPSAACPLSESQHSWEELPTRMVARHGGSSHDGGSSMVARHEARVRRHVGRDGGVQQNDSPADGEPTFVLAAPPPPGNGEFPNPLDTLHEVTTYEPFESGCRRRRCAQQKRR